MEFGFYAVDLPDAVRSQMHLKQLRVGPNLTLDDIAANGLFWGKGKSYGRTWSAVAPLDRALLSSGLYNL